MPTALSKDEEEKFQRWYAHWAKVTRVNPDPDSPKHYYDYRKAYKLGLTPKFDPTDQKYHWTSEPKGEEHPTRYVGGYDTATGRRLSPDEHREIERAKGARKRRALITGEED